MDAIPLHLAWSLGLVLAAALVGGQFASFFGLPRVTAYLLVGLALGPQGLAHLPWSEWGFPDLLQQVTKWLAVPEADLEHLAPFGELAMSLVLFHIGCHFTLPRTRRIASRVLPLSLGELSAVFVLISLGTWLCGTPIEIALLLGTLGLATAPATTMLVFKEKQSEGPITEFSLALLVLNNLAAIISFELLLLGIHAFSEPVAGREAISLQVEIRELIGGLLGATSLGIVAGLIVSYTTSLLGQNRWLVLFLAMALLVMGICEARGLNLLLAFLAIGITVANASDRSKMIEKELDRITGLLCVVFFVIEGAKMDLLALQAAGLVGVVFIICRSAGKYLGVFFAARHRKEDPVLQYWLGATLISQAGVALALCTLAVDFDPELGEELRAIIFGTVIAFEIAGPILVKLAIIQGGEVPMAEAIRHTSTTPWEEFRAMLNRLLLSTGRNPWATKKPGEVLVSQIMRTHVKGVPTSASFDQLVDYMEHSHDNTFPVINDEKTLVGVIRFNDLRDALFDPELGSLVYAVDLTQTARHVLKKSDTAERALQLLNASDDDAVPVIDDTESKHFIGVVRRRDVMRMLRK